jgi:predicted Zn-dependent protease
VRKKLNIAFATAVLAAGSFTACATRTPGTVPQPGFNSYTVEQDIEIGRQLSAEADKQVPLANNRDLQNYVTTLGQRLARQPEGGSYPYTFKMINDPQINAFALPGGPVYLNSGIVMNADNEAQVAGVLAHEISHVALRHGTNQASKAQLFDILGQIGASVLGDRGAVAQIGQLGLGVGLSAVLLSYSRAAESEADALGARIMSGAGYNPVEMARFFEKLEEGGGGGAVEFLSSHPSPGNRVAAVSEEIKYIPQRSYGANTGNFVEAKREVQRLPAPPKPRAAAQ